MKKILTPSLLIAFFLSGCATKPVHLVSIPKAEKLMEMKKALISHSEVETKNEAEELAKDYLLALIAKKEGDKKRACALFSDLADAKELPIHEAALVQSLSVCDYSSRELIHLWKKTSPPSYLKETYLDFSKSLAAEKNLPLFEAEFSYDLINYRPTHSEKLKLIKRSIQIAENLKDEEKIKFYNERLKEISPMYNTNINDQNIYVIAKDFETNRKFETARELYRKIIEGSFSIEEKIKAYNSYRTSFKVERNLKTFLEKTYEMEHFLNEEMQKNPDDKKTIEGWADTKIALARAVWTSHERDAARKILEEFIDSKKGNANQIAQAYFVFGSLLLETKENKEALKKFEQASTYKITDQNLAENIQWSIIWNYYLLKNDQAVLKFTDQFIKKSNNPNFTAKLNFWKAKSLERTRKKEEATDVLTALSSSDSFGYYGILASMELGKPLTPLTMTAINTEPSNNQILDWLVGVDEKEFSQKYLKEMDSQFKGQEQREKAMSLYALTEWYQGGMRQIYNFKQSIRNSLTEKYSAVVYPIPYLSTVSALSQKYSVPAELIYGITRQESAFVPSERSWADAFGLMQMIPEKAHELSKKYGIPYQDYNDLYVPDINLEMGTALLKNLREKFQFKFAQTVASYNASDEVIRVWEKERFNGNYIEFIEMIPYEETRNYIKLVFRNFITYKRLLNKTEFVVDKDFFAKPF